MKKLLPLLLLSAFLLTTGSLHAQSVQEPNIQKLVDEQAEAYFKAAEGQALIYNGKDQPRLGPNVHSKYLRQKGFKEPKIADLDQDINVVGTFTEGSLFYDNIEYTPVSMRLDWYTDELTLTTPDRMYAIVLNPDKVEYADLLGYHVIHIQPGEYSLRSDEFSEKLPSGYYLQLYAGEYSILKKETYTFRETDGRFVDMSIRYYIGRNGVYTRVKNKSAALAVLGSHTKELEAYAKQAGLNFNRHMEDALVALVEEFERLTKKQ